MLLPHVLWFILDTFQRTGAGERKGRERPLCRISYKYRCPAPYVGTGPKYSRQSACGKAWASYQIASSKDQIRDLKFKRETNKMNWASSSELVTSAEWLWKATSLLYVLVSRGWLGYSQTESSISAAYHSTTHLFVNTNKCFQSWNFGQNKNSFCLSTTDYVSRTILYTIHNLSSFYTYRNWSSERWSNLMEVTQLTSGRTRIVM